MEVRREERGMATAELMKTPQCKPDDVVCDAVTMALGVLVQRIQSLPHEDQVELYELVKEMRHAKEYEEVNSIVVAMREVLDQKPVRLNRIHEGDAEPKDGLQKWMDYVSAKI